MTWRCPNARPSTVIGTPKPGEVGQVARDCECRRLLVTHVMPELESELDDALELMRRTCSRELVVAEDLMRVVV